MGMRRGFLLICAVFAQSWPVFADEELRITTYFPAPYGTHKAIRLYPRKQPAPCQEGEMYFDPGSATTVKGLYVCNQENKWVSPGGEAVLFGGMYQNGERNTNNECPLGAQYNSTDPDTYPCCESINPVTGGCSCDPGMTATCLSGTQEPDGEYAGTGLPRERHDEYCFCWKWQL